jgi:hypothetical protein
MNELRAFVGHSFSEHDKTLDLMIAIGTTADEIANEATKRYLAVRRLDRLQRYGQKRAEELGITEDDVPRLIAESRAERRR